MQSLATKIGMSETAFVIPQGEIAQIRWFSPTTEINLCGHATLAACLALKHTNQLINNKVTFQSKSGDLPVEHHSDSYRMIFPQRPGVPAPCPPLLETALGTSVLEFYSSIDHLAVLDSEKTVRELTPDLALLAQIEGEGVIITAPGSKSDFVCRVFAPQVGIPEDPVTGSAHCTLAPYWSKRLQKKNLLSHQVSQRGGEVWCEVLDSQIAISGMGRIQSTNHLFADN